jgi:lactoylglutathione lyase
MGNGFSWLEAAPKDAESCHGIYPKRLMSNYEEHKPSVFFICDDIDDVCTEMKKKGVIFSKDVTSLGWGKFAVFMDEDGNEFGLKG